MTYGIYLSAAGANAQSHRLEVLSNNLANINTTGFKPHMSMLQSQHAEGIQQGETMPGDGGVDDVGGAVGIQPNRTQFEQGPIQQTGRPTDFAIHDEESFFAIQRGDKQLLTRAGNFMFNSAGMLVTQQGHPVLGSGGGPISINPALPHHIADDGKIQQAGLLQQVDLVRPPAIGDLARVGDNLFDSLTGMEEVPSDQRALRSHSLESSAVNPTQSMVELIEASRVYEANVRMIQSQDESMGQLLGRVLGS